ncbi:MAG: hypothetical protein GH143_10590 [Calditrichaeota bacterium]|nr:hypothetical protein [Calditrichota bacterium]
MNPFEKPHAKRCIVILLLALLSGCIAIQQGLKDREPFFFIQMSDPQFGMFASDSSFQEETRLFQEAIAHANCLDPAFVVITGDLVNKPGDPAQIAELRRIASQIHSHIPLHWVPGNHDIGNVPSPVSLVAYREIFGPDWYSFACGNWRFIVLNSTIVHRPDKVEAELARQWTWLEETLTRDTRTYSGTIIFQHHLLFMTDPDEEDRYENIPQLQRTRYLNLFKRNGVSAVFAGHYHGNGYGRNGDLEMVITGPVGKTLRQDPSGFRIVKVYPDHIEHAYYGFADMLKTIAFDNWPLLQTVP